MNLASSNLKSKNDDEFPAKKERKNERRLTLKASAVDGFRGAAMVVLQVSDDLETPIHNHNQSQFTHSALPSTAFELSYTVIPLQIMLS